MGYKLNLKNPQTLNEKINWLKLYDRTALHTQCSDKYEVRKFVSEQIGEEFLVPLYLETEDPQKITPGNIINTPCIIKTNHDSSGGFFIYNKNKINWVSLQKKLSKRLHSNYFWSSREWQYKNIKPRIIVEKLLQDVHGDIPNDYKFHCFNGKVRMISVDIGRNTENHHRNWYSRNWEREPYKWSSHKGNKYTDPTENDLDQPENFELMKSLSEKLASPFCYARIDWYDVNGKLFFGEITFHHDGGYLPILPQIWDKKLGGELNLERVEKG
ncbi:ATP-grasp fold amidoligase family protein [Zobellia galactanivorans]|uniref:ATP-grasp fold amidoligase family protein n=1 Tax=Zobellia galactanivorans (strain DSM 12802 / CCUG 47099 / CIP 106680 / NCIMB 13871 / Dsij) TaxID=63186 RepID=UPI002090D795|nr:ATP-grasp fold amidoligase family protein [Zobellia galactanivorans]